MARQQQYVSCPFCGDPVPGPLPRTGEFLQCTYCKNTFPFDVQAVRTALIEFHEPEQRWAIVPIHTEIDTQTTRILELCTQAVPGCIVHVTPVGPDSFRMKVEDGVNVLLDSDVPLYTHELAAKSDGELSMLLEKLSNERVRCKRQ